VADDAEDNRFLILSYLNQAKCSIEIATNGQEAAEKFRGGGFDVVLMDVEMPVLDGYGAVQEIRRIEKEKGMAATPVVALTAHAFADMADKSREAGFTAHLTKPIRKATLLQALGGYAGKSRVVEMPPAPAKVEESTDEFLVHVEQGMEDVVPAYLEKRRKDIETYRLAIGSSDFDLLRMLGHKMKGTGTGYGFPVLTEIGDAIERAALKKDTAGATAAVDRLAGYVEKVKLQYAQ
jgi:CheY-like chemotaxis protein